MSTAAATFVVVGGGVAGVSCAEELCRLAPTSRVVLVSASAVLKGITNYVKITDCIDSFEVEERPLSAIEALHRNLRVVNTAVVAVNEGAREVLCEDGSRIGYTKLCICSGAAPRRVIDHPLVLGVRDVESVDLLCAKLASARRVLVVGNGGIALELVHAIRSCEVVWAMKHSYIGSTFLDASSSAFFLSCRSDWREVPAGTASLPRPATTIKPVDESRGDMETSCGGSGVSDSTPRSRMCGSALGPQWVRDVAAAGDTSQGAAQVLIAKGADCLAYCSQGSGWHSVLDGSALAAPPATCSTDDDDRDPWPLRVLLSTGLQCGVDFVVSATGVTPATAFLDDSFVRDSEGALVVTESMLCVGKSSVYCAGDAACIPWSESPSWFQMRLWRQARFTAIHAAQCMTGFADELSSGMSFELFTHMTRFCGFKVVLIGQFNGQGLGVEYEDAIKACVTSVDGPVRASCEAGPGATVTSVAHADGDEAMAPRRRVELQFRITPGVEYIKIVLVDGAVKGAMLIGDTELEETFENLVLDGLTVGATGVGDILNPDHDIEDYFD